MKTMHSLLLGLLLLSSPALAVDWVDGEVRRVDEANGKVTIKHGEINDLKMPPMTMVFSLKDPEWAKKLKPGQEIRFQAKDLGGGKLQIEVLEPKAP